VREFLQEIAARSKGKILLHLIDPQPFSRGRGSAPPSRDPARAGGQLRRSLYLGLAGTNSTDGAP